jgi:hypothetical protein
MPRLLADGPGLAVSPDHALLAIAGGGRLRLCDTRTREQLAEAPLSEDPVEIGFAQAAGSARLLAFVRHEATTQALAFLLPRLELAAQLELIGQVRPAAFVGDRVLVYNDAGEQPRIVTLAPRALEAQPIALREPVQLAAAAPEERLLIAARDQVECWDPALRRALYRLNLPVSKPRQAGFAARRRLLWVASAGQIEVFRFSDGRLQLRVELGRRFLAAAGHPESPRLVVALAPDGGEPELEEFDLALQERRELRLEGTPAAFCLIEGEAPELVTAAADGRLAHRSLPKLGTQEAPHSATNRGKPRATPQPAVGGGAPPKAPAPDRGAPDWRSRLGKSPAATSAVRERVAVSDDDREVTGEYQEPPTQPRALADGRRSWRDRAVGWAERALAGSAEEASSLLDERSPIGDLARRFELDSRAVAALALLYAGWLNGEGRHGLPAAHVARTLARLEPDASSRPDDEACWSEALGRGTLGREGLAHAHGGRIRLRAAVGRFLDGTGARIEIVAAAAPLKAVPATLTSGPWRVALPDEEDRKAARTIARRLGQDVALIELSAERPAARQLLEARLHGAVPLLCGDPAALEQALDQLPPVLMLVGYRGYCPEALANLPIFEID